MSLQSSAPKPLREFERHGIRFAVYADANQMGAASAHALAAEQLRLASSQERVGFLIMAAPSAYPFYTAYVKLAESSGPLRDAIARTHFFQFDDYPLPADHPATFRHLLEKNLFTPLRALRSQVNFYPLNVDQPDAARICVEYASNVLELGPDLQLKGVGENGHWGFHEPGIPLDGDPAYIRVETTGENTAQQLRDHPSLFKRAEDVPREAYTANVPLFLRTRTAIEDNVPQPSKAFALLGGYATDIVDAAVPTSALKHHPNAIVRTTEGASWALEKYVREERIAEADVARLAAALGASTPENIQSTLQTMQIRIID